MCLRVVFDELLVLLEFIRQGKPPTQVLRLVGKLLRQRDGGSLSGPNSARPPPVERKSDICTAKAQLSRSPIMGAIWLAARWLFTAAAIFHRNAFRRMALSSLAAAI